jgi:hypothetical protein
MKIRLQHKGGRIETVTIKGPVKIVTGKELDRLRTATGVDLFFTKDGYFDGCGCAIGESRRADELIEELEDRHA